MSIAVLIAAAGSSRRYQQHLEFPRNKLDEDLGGRPLLQRTVELFTKHELVTSIIVAGPHDDDAFAAFRLRHGDKLALLGATLCRGGPDARWQTVRAMLEHVPDDATHIAVHDAARPATPAELIDRLFDAAGHHDAVVPCVEVADTIKRASPAIEDKAADDPFAAILGDQPAATVRCVEETLDRARLVAVQTPQVFERSLLVRAYAQGDLTSTDDAGLVERLGEPVTLIEGDPRNIKVTTPTDLSIVRAVMGLHTREGRASHKRF